MVICVRFVLHTASSSFGGCMIRLLPGVPVDGVAGLLDPPQTLRSITLLCTAPFIKPRYSPPAGELSPHISGRVMELSLPIPLWGIKTSSWKILTAATQAWI